jgi:hypothetical protein
MSKYQDTYEVYEFNKLRDKFDSETEYSDDVVKFFESFSFDIVINKIKEKNETANVFTNIVKENTTRAKITALLNKLHAQNITTVIKNIRQIAFQSEEELNELVQQCIQKIKRDSEQVRPLVAHLCLEISNTYFITKDNTDNSDKKIYFRKLLLGEVRQDYMNSIDYDSDTWTKERGEKSMILIGTLYNGKVIGNEIMSKIIGDFRNKIDFKENEPNEYYESVEKSINLLSSLVSCVVINEESKVVYGDLDNYLESKMALYEDKKFISKKIRYICKNIITELKKK